MSRQCAWRLETGLIDSSINLFVLFFVRLSLSVFLFVGLLVDSFARMVFDAVGRENRPVRLPWRCWCGSNKWFNITISSYWSSNNKMEANQAVRVVRLHRLTCLRHRLGFSDFSVTATRKCCNHSKQHSNNRLPLIQQPVPDRYLSLFFILFYSIHPSIRPSIILSILFHLSISLSVCLSIHLSCYECDTFYGEMITTTDFGWTELAGCCGINQWIGWWRRNGGRGYGC